MLLVALSALVPLIITPGILFYYDVTPMLIVLLAGTGIASIWFFPSSYRGWFYPLAALQVLSVALSTAFSADRSLSFFGSNWRSLGLLAQIVLMLFAVLVYTWAAGNRARMNLLLRAVAASGCLAAIYGILQY